MVTRNLQNPVIASLRSRRGNPLLTRTTTLNLSRHCEEAASSSRCGNPKKRNLTGQNLPVIAREGTLYPTAAIQKKEPPKAAHRSGSPRRAYGTPRDDEGGERQMRQDECKSPRCLLRNLLAMT